MVRNWLQSWDGWTTPWAGRRGAVVMGELEDGAMRVGPMVIVPERHEATLDGQVVPLTAMEFSILELLAARPGVVFSPEQIAEACHDGATRVQPRSVNRRVQSLRRKLGEAGEMITNMRGVGYCLRVEDDGLSGQRWWSMAPLALMQWWSSRSVPGKASTLVGAAVIAASAGWGVARLDPVGFGTSAMQGVVLRGAAVWHAPETAASIDPLAQLQAATAWSGIGSSLAYTGQNDEYLVLSDRGYDDGRYDADCRWHRLRITADGQGGLVLKWLGQTLLVDEQGEALTGGGDDLTHRYDPEAMAIDSHGRVWLADEYGPAIDVFSPQGKRIRRLPIPEGFAVQSPATNAQRERNSNVLGRVPNRGIEAMAIDEAVNRVWVMTQSPLIQDGGESGRFLRLHEMTFDGQAVGQWVYTLSEPGHQVSEMIAAGGSLFVLERDTLAGEMAHFKRLFSVRVNQASNVLPFTSLPGDALPEQVRAVSKRVAVDLLAVATRAEGLHTFEQFEGLTWGPSTPAGQRQLVLTTDNGDPGAMLQALMNVYMIQIDPDRLTLR